MKQLSLTARVQSFIAPLPSLIAAYESAVAANARAESTAEAIKEAKAATLLFTEGNPPTNSAEFNGCLDQISETLAQIEESKSALWHGLSGLAELAQEVFVPLIAENVAAATKRALPFVDGVEHLAADYARSSETVWPYANALRTMTSNMRSINPIGHARTAVLHFGLWLDNQKAAA